MLPMLTRFLKTFVYISFVFSLPYSVKNLWWHIKMHIVSRIKIKSESEYIKVQ